jgi:hypothetical protein
MSRHIKLGQGTLVSILEEFQNLFNKLFVIRLWPPQGLGVLSICPMMRW